MKRPHLSNSLPITQFYDVPQPLPPGKPGELIRKEPVSQYSLPYEISAFRILYHSRNVRGEDIAVSAVVLVPDGHPPAGGWPVVAWAHEFKALSRQSAPSLLKNLGLGPLLAMYTNLGYAVVATDFAGLGVDTGTPVIDAPSNALDVIYSVVAARFAVKEIGPRWIAVGAVHGAAAAIATATGDYHDSPLFDTFLGAVALSGLPDPPQQRARVPVLIVNGEQGQSSVADDTARNVGKLCKLGGQVLLLKYPNLDSSGAISASAGDQISWIKARFAGAPAPSICR